MHPESVTPPKTVIHTSTKRTKALLPFVSLKLVVVRNVCLCASSCSFLHTLFYVFRAVFCSQFLFDLTRLLFCGHGNNFLNFWSSNRRPAKKCKKRHNSRICIFFAAFLLHFFAFSLEFLQFFGIFEDRRPSQKCRKCTVPEVAFFVAVFLGIFALACFLHAAFLHVFF